MTVNMKHPCVMVVQPGSIIMRSLHSMHEMNLYRAGHVCLTACFKSRSAVQILTKFCMVIVPL
jgi:hypothetical protein